MTPNNNLMDKLHLIFVCLMIGFVLGISFSGWVMEDKQEVNYHEYDIHRSEETLYRI